MGGNAFLEYSKEIINKATTQIEKTWIQLVYIVELSIPK